MTLKEALESEEVKAKIAKSINDAVDIPIISEKVEGKIAEKCVDLVFDGLLKVIG